MVGELGSPRDYKTGIVGLGIPKRDPSNEEERKNWKTSGKNKNLNKFKFKLIKITFNATIMG